MAWFTILMPPLCAGYLHIIADRVWLIFWSRALSTDTLCFHVATQTAAPQQNKTTVLSAYLVYMGYEPTSFISLLFCSTLNRSSSVQLLSTFKKPASFPLTAHPEYFTGAGMGVGGVNPEAIYTSCIILKNYVKKITS